MKGTRGLVSILLALLAGCDELPFDGDGDPVVVVTSTGEVQRLSAGDDSASALWTASIDSSNQVSIAADGSDLFVASGQEIGAWDRDSGEAIWDAPVAMETEVVALAGVGGGAVFARTFDALVALQAADGGEIWRLDGLDLAGAADSALAYGSGAVFLGGSPMRRIDPASGGVTDEEAGDQDTSEIAVGGSTLYAGMSSGVQAFGAAGLSFQWENPTADGVDHLSVGDDSVLYSVLGGGVGALTLGGNPIGEAQDGEVFDALAISGNLLLAARTDGTLFAFDEAQVEEVWVVEDTQGTVWDLAVNDRTVFYAVDGVLEAINLEDAAALWTHNTDGNIVAVEAL